MCSQHKIVDSSYEQIAFQQHKKQMASSDFKFEKKKTRSIDKDLIVHQSFFNNQRQLHSEQKIFTQTSTNTFRKNQAFLDDPWHLKSEKESYQSAPKLKVGQNNEVLKQPQVLDLSQTIKNLMKEEIKLQDGLNKAIGQGSQESLIDQGEKDCFIQYEYACSRFALLNKTL